MTNEEKKLALSDFETELILAYRTAEDFRKEAVRCLLEVLERGERRTETGHLIRLL